MHFIAALTKFNDFEKCNNPSDVDYVIWSFSAITKTFQNVYSFKMDLDLLWNCFLSTLNGQFALRLFEILLRFWWKWQNSTSRDILDFNLTKAVRPILGP